MKKIEQIVEVRLDETGNIEGTNRYRISYPLSQEDLKLTKKAEKFEKETGLIVCKPKRKMLDTMYDYQWITKLFPARPKTKNKIKTYKITIEEVK